MASLCEKFKKNMSINPYTNRKILIGGPTYTALLKECSPSSSESSVRNLCDVFRKSVDVNRAKNPLTGNRIKVGGAIYKTWERRCENKSTGDDFVCAMFLKNKTINPVTGRSIKVGGPTYNMLMEKCEELDASNKLVKKVLHLPLTETKQIVSKWYTETALEEMFRVLVKTKGEEKRAEIFGEYVQKSLYNILNKKIGVHRNILSKLFIFLFGERIGTEFSGTRFTITVDVLDYVNDRSKPF